MSQKLSPQALNIIFYTYSNFIKIIKKQMKEYEGKYEFERFKQLVENYVSGDIYEIWSLVKSAINQ